MQVAMRFDLDLRRQLTPRSRLAISLAIATILHLLVLFFVRIDLPGSGKSRALAEIELRLPRKPPLDKEAAVDNSQDMPPALPTESPPAIVTPPVPPEPVEAARGPATESRPAVDWQKLAEQTAREVVTEKAQEEAHSADMWRRTRSIMFSPRPDYSAENEPYLPGLPLDDRRFKGIGFKLGERCFFGIPGNTAEDVDSDAVDLSTRGMRSNGVGLIQCDF